MKCARFIKSLFFLHVTVISSTYRIHLPRPLSKVIYESDGEKKRKTEFRRDNGSGLNQGIYCIFRKIRFLPTETRPLFPYYRRGDGEEMEESEISFLRIDRVELFIYFS